MAVKNFETLYDFQKVGATWLAGRTHALLADDMGLGKSAQAITACDEVKAGKVLVICPAAARVNWRREFEIFSPQLRPVVVENSRSNFSSSDSLIVSYDLISKNPNLGSFDVTILDESHFVKGLDTKRTQAILGSKGTIHRTKYFWALSGTPAPNHVGELWPLLYTLGVTPLTYPKYISRYCNSYEWQHGPVITGTKKGMELEIREMLSRIMLRRRKEDVLKELPQIFYQSVIVEPGPVDIDTDIGFVNYVFPVDRRHELVAKLAEENALLESAIRSAGLGADGLKVLEGLAKSVSTLRRYTGLQKIKSVADIIEAELTANAYEKIVLFGIHQAVIEGLRTRLSKFGAVTLYGKTPPEKRDENINSFQNNPKCRVFIGNIQAAGTAITLTAAHNVAFVESEWVPAHMAQAAMRCHRIGQTKPVTVRFFSLSNSVDEKISERLKRKTKELTEIFDAN